MGEIKAIGHTHHPTAALLVRRGLVSSGGEQRQSLSLLHWLMMLRVRRWLVAEKNYNIFFCQNGVHILSMGTTAGQRNASSSLATYPSIMLLYIKGPASRHMGGTLAISEASVCFLSCRACTWVVLAYYRNSPRRQRYGSDLLNLFTVSIVPLSVVTYTSCQGDCPFAVCLATTSSSGHLSSAKERDTYFGRV